MMKDQQTEFNMDISSLNRLNIAIYMCNQAALNMNANEWYHQLGLFFRELSNGLKNEEEVDKYNKMWLDIKPLLDSHLRRINMKSLNSIDANLYHALHKYELKLRWLMKELGLEKTMKEAADKALQ